MFYEEYIKLKNRSSNATHNGRIPPQTDKEKSYYTAVNRTWE